MLRARHIAVKGRNAHWFSWLYRTKFCVIQELRLLQTFAGVLQKKIRTRAVFKETSTNYISKERL